MHEFIFIIFTLFSGSGEIDFNEFAEVMAEQFYKKPTRRELEAAFKYFDTGQKMHEFGFLIKKKTFFFLYIDNSGYISEDELLAAIKKFKSGVTKNEIKRMMK